ncbi:helix-turn-helix domain-containing protein [Alistipes sp. OttesenSCG-928-L06]|nr:helix-turn-helix domain-containing protein [Alistipes sp. OttesenSCG-928-L06]
MLIAMNPHQYNEIKAILLDIQSKVSAIADAAQKELLTPAEVCKMLKIGRTTYQRHVDNGVFDQVRIDKGRAGKVYVRRADIERLIEEGKL